MKKVILKTYQDYLKTPIMLWSIFIKKSDIGPVIGYKIKMNKDTENERCRNGKKI